MVFPRIEDYFSRLGCDRIRGKAVGVVIEDIERVQKIGEDQKIEVIEQCRDTVDIRMWPLKE